MWINKQPEKHGQQTEAVVKSSLMLLIWPFL